MQISFTVDGVVQLSRLVTDLSATVQDWSPALSQSSDDILEFITNDVFDTEGEALGQPWQPLSAKYAVWKEKNYPGQPILQRTGAMRQGFISAVDSSTLTIGNSISYFPYHQSLAPRRVLPRRAMMQLTDNLKATIIQNFREQMLAATGGL